MYEIRIELVEVEEPGGEIQGVPLIVQRTDTIDDLQMANSVFNTITDTLIDEGFV